MSQSNDTRIELFSPSLPKGGGSMTGMGGSMAAPSSDGIASFNVPIPVSSSRGLTPNLNLSYNSGGGNGPFGIGWNMGIMQISRRTTKGIPKYTLEDQFMGPDGEVMIPERNAQGQLVNRKTDTAQGIPLGEVFTVTRYFPRIEGSFNLIEYWQAEERSVTAPFWLVHSADGSLNCLGKNSQARIASKNVPEQIAEWLLEESLSPLGEHIYYEYKEENSVGINLEQNNHQYGSNRYIQAIRYGNRVPSDTLYLWDRSLPIDDQWLYTVVFDYGNSQLTIDDWPKANFNEEWALRSDSFSGYEYGFELRTCRLCRHIFMYHNFIELGEEPTLIWRISLEYGENPTVSRLSSVQQVAYEKDGSRLSLPPLELDYTSFNIKKTVDWEPFLPFSEFKANISYHMVDLFGEGIPGMLYQDQNQWYYRSPIRSHTPDGITYEQWKPLPKIPANIQSGMLMDMDGDGYLDWLIVESGVVGSYSMNSDKTWSQFVPLKALPTEFFHEKAMFSNITGSSLTDLVMIGPKSVRFYAGEEGGFQKALEVWQDAGITLPIARFDRQELVAFGDLLGSGQSHLVHIKYNGVTCWPNMGNGVFGSPLELPGFHIEKASFNPEYVYLVDLDGSGPADLIYAAHDCLLVYQNLSGNGFSEPLRIPLPDGVHFDHLCRLIPTDISGLGVANLILNVPHSKPRSWYLNLCELKPYLLKSTNNNLGGAHSFFYRSSAQYWLDEKKKDPTAVPALPFPINVLSCVQTLDEISGHCKVETYTYGNGYYDKDEKEFTGFGYIELKEEERDHQGIEVSQTPPTLSRTWYHRGRKEDEEKARDQYWQEDSAAFSLNPTLLTQFDLETKKDQPMAVLSDQQEYWLYRSLKGMPIRTEIFAEDPMGSCPYVTESFRYQVRLLSSHGSECLTLPLSIEQLTYQYEQIVTDPQCTQQIQQFYDEYGFATQSVTIHYPRRVKPEDNPYPDTLPETSWGSSYDTQQSVLRLIRQREKMYHLTSFENWRLGISHQTRMDTYGYSIESVCSHRISIESLSGEGTLAFPAQEQAYGGQTEIIYLGETVPDLRALVYYTRSAVLDESSLQAYEGVLSPEELKSLLDSSGYKQSKRLLSDEEETDVFVAELGFTRYAEKEGFYQMIGQQASLLTGEQVLSWDEFYCVITSVSDVLGNKTQINYDYRFLQPIKITDANHNESLVTLDALGRVTDTRIWGTENGEEVGFNPEVEFIPPKTIDQGLILTPSLPVASCFVYDDHSWMGRLSLEQLSKTITDSATWWSFLIKQRFITSDGRIRARGRIASSHDELVPPAILCLLRGVKRQPTIVLNLSADRYPSDPAQQIQANIMFSDGFGRTIHCATRTDPVPNQQLLRSHHKIATDSDNLVERWIISERVVYSVNGLVLRTSQPFYFHDWQYIQDKDMNQPLYITSYDYDHLGRERRTVNPKGYERRVTIYPWFTVNEDENDTMHESQIYI